jgi:predicted transcriptional regulator
MINSNLASKSPRRDIAPQGDAGGPDSIAVADLICNRIVRLPSWFTVEQARKVVTLRGLEYVLVEEHGQICGFVGRAALWRAKPSEQLAHSVCRSKVSISADTPVAQARTLMLQLGVECLTVVKSGILVGTVSLADIDFNLEGAHALSA